MIEYSTIEHALDELRAGRLIMCTDDPERENEGDLICAALFATTENINFMATHAKGRICMPMNDEYIAKLALPQMVARNTDNHETAFTVSIDHVDTTTGISAAERSITAMKCVDPDAQPQDFRRPGHMFPLLAKAGGVLERNGHTEATVDLCRRAGLEQCGLCCEIMRDDGTMMRASELAEKAKEWGLAFITIKDLQEYRKTHDHLVEPVAAAKMPTAYGTFVAHGVRNSLNGEHHVALVKGDIGDGENVLVRVHSECLTGDAFGSLRCDCGEQLHKAMEMIDREGRGAVVYLNQEGRGIGLCNKIHAYKLQDEGLDTVDANLKLGFKADERDYGVGASIIRELGIRHMRLMTNNPLKRAGLEGYGLCIDEIVPIVIAPNPYNAHYLETKQERMHHTLGLEKR